MGKRGEQSPARVRAICPCGMRFPTCGDADLAQFGQSTRSVISDQPVQDARTGRVNSWASLRSLGYLSSSGGAPFTRRLRLDMCQKRCVFFEACRFHS